MDNSSNLLDLLEHITYPVFLVKNGIITDANNMALQHQIEIGAPIAPLLCSGVQEYIELSNGRLCLTLCIANITYSATVTRVEDHDLFCLESESIDPELRSLSVAAQALRLPLSDAMLCVDRLIEVKDTDLIRQAQILKRNLHRLHRTICNMSDTANYGQSRSLKTKTCNLTALLDEVLEKASGYLSLSGRKLEYTSPSKPAYSIADSEKLERAVLNLISNAAKYGSIDAPIQVSVEHDSRSFRIAVSNQLSDPNTAFFPNLFSAFQREPGIYDKDAGVGLGMTIVRNAAAAHGGSLLFDQPQESTARFTLTIPINNKESANLRAPVLYPVDYSGGYDHTLTELSDILPDNLY